MPLIMPIVVIIDIVIDDDLNIIAGQSVTINWIDFLRAYTMNLYEERKFNDNDDVRKKTT